jgi:hypothetical protein
VDNGSKALSVRPKFRLMQKPSNIPCNFNIAYVKPNQTITDMAKTAFEKVFVLGEKRWTLQAMQQDEDILVLRTETRNLFADLSIGDSPLT